LTGIEKKIRKKSLQNGTGGESQEVEKSIISFLKGCAEILGSDLPGEGFYGASPISDIQTRSAE
jgi:hypothetical protein